MAAEASGVQSAIAAGPSSDAAPTPEAETVAAHGGHGGSVWTLALGSIGVVFGDIGTSPLYAMREALSHSRGGGGGDDAVLGVVSLVLWAMTLIVTVKYV